MEWSDKQLDVYTAIETTDSNLLIVASAGCGKSTVIKHGSKLIKKNKRIAFFSFGRDIAKELRAELPLSIDVATLHSMGCKSLYAHFKRVEVREYKTQYFIDKYKLLDEWDIKADQREVYKYNMAKAMDLIRMNLLNTPEAFLEGQIEELILHYDLDFNPADVPNIFDLFQIIESYNRKQPAGKEKKMIDFTDMIYLPATLKGIRLTLYDVVFIDECQDLNKAQHLLLQKIKAINGRFIAVGDPAQCIYGFAGSDIESFNKFGEHPNTITLPLSTSYRCAKSVVNAAQAVYPHIEPYEKNDEGVVRHNGMPVEECKEGDFVLCRNTQPLIVLYYQLLKEGKRSLIKGKDIGKGIIDVVNKCLDLGFQEAFLQYAEQIEYMKQKLQERGYQNVASHPKIETFKEKVGIIKILSTRYSSMREISGALERMFTDMKDKKDTKNIILLMTIHKSKGLESDRVFIIRPDLMLKNPRATQAWQKLQEKNLRYVAITRAKKELIYVPQKNFDDTKLCKESKF